MVDDENEEEEESEEDDECDEESDSESEYCLEEEAEENIADNEDEDDKEKLFDDSVRIQDTLQRRHRQQDSTEHFFIGQTFMDANEARKDVNRYVMLTWRALVVNKSNKTTKVRYYF